MSTRVLVFYTRGRVKSRTYVPTVHDRFTSYAHEIETAALQPLSVCKSRMLDQCTDGLVCSLPSLRHRAAQTSLFLLGNDVLRLSNLSDIRRMAGLL